MQSIKMKVTCPGSMDGLSAKKYVAGETYEINDLDMNNYLAKIFLKSGLAERVAPEPPAPSEPSAPVAPSEKKDDDLGIEDGDLEDLDLALDSDQGSSEDVESDEMGLRVYQLADELGKGSKEIMEAAKELDIDATAPASGLSSSEIEKIKASFNE